MKHYLAAVEPLNELSPTGWNITDAGLVYLYGLTNLRQLSVVGIQVACARVAELKKMLPTCDIRGP